MRCFADLKSFLHLNKMPRSRSKRNSSVKPKPNPSRKRSVKRSCDVSMPKSKCLATIASKLRKSLLTEMASLKKMSCAIQSNIHDIRFMLTKASSDEEKQALKPVLDWENYQLEQMKSKYENLEEKVEKMEEVGLFPCGSKILKHSSEKCDGDQQDVQHLEKLLYKYIFEEAIKLNVYNSHLKKRMVELNICANKITVECNKEKLYKSIDALVAKYDRSLYRQERLLAILPDTASRTNLLTIRYGLFLGQHPELGSVLYNLGIKYAIEPKSYNEFDVDNYKATRSKCEYKEL